MNKGYVSKIETLSLVDGPGIRVVVFLSGCNRRCIYCHNPEMLNIASGKIYSTGELFSIIMKYKPYFGNNGGVTFSGGEPLLQKNFLKQMIKLCHNNGINICIETAGLEVEDNVIENIDLIILDLKAINDDMSLKLTNMPINVQNSFIKQCQRLKKKLIIRHVIIPGINDTTEYINNFKNYIKDIKYIKKVELLPYHNMAIDKYKELNISYKLENTLAMDKSVCMELNNLINKND